VIAEVNHSCGVWAQPGMERTECILCVESRTVALYDDLSDVHYGGEGSFSVRRCVQCELTWLSPRPDSERMKDYYGVSYVPYEDRTNRARTALAPLRTLLSFPYQMRYGQLGQTSTPPRPGARMLDVGCGPGQLLEAMRKIGWEVWGIEMDAAAASKAARRAGDDERVFVGPIGNAKYPQGKFDLITASHVLEHLHDPLMTLKQMHRWLRPGGYLQIWVPNIVSIESKVFGRHWSGLDTPRHLYHFSPATISRMLDRAAFDVTSWRPQFQGSSFGSSVKQALASMTRRRPGRPATGLIYRSAVPLGWVMCGLGGSAAIEVHAIARKTPIGAVQVDELTPAQATAS
jgi:2-polyprenyl-3-methyl-5-hydroxy-6-metoxy-1,4-benzoquinol methylase